jgi:phage terminase small subunit
MDEEEKSKMYNEVIALTKTIPKEHRKTVNKIANLYRKIGAVDVLEIVKTLSEIDINNVTSYCVCHDSEIDGG